MNHRHCFVNVLVGAIGLVLAGVTIIPAAFAQNAANARGGSADAQAATPAPGEEVMQPTANGITFSPRMVELFSKGVTKNMTEGMKLSTAQEAKVRQSMAKRTQEIVDRRGHEAANAYQTLIDESISGGLDPSKPESFRRLAESVKPSLSIVPEFMDGMREDLRPALNAEQMRLMDERCKKAHDWYEQRQHMMDRWAKGDVRPDEEWFRAFGDDDLSGELNNSSDGSRSRVSRDMQWAKRRSENPLFDCDPKFWGQFLVDAKQTFGMSAAQFNAGQEILKSYREKAEAIMTYEWRQQVQRNRYKSYVQNVNVGEPTGPYLYAVEREYRQLTRPLLEIKRAFHRDVIALTTYEQRTKVLEGLQKYGMSHGMTGDELSLPAMSLMSIPVATTSQPATSAP